MPAQRYSIHDLVGVDGWLTLLLSNVLIVVSGGLSLLLHLRRVHCVARLTPAESDQFQPLTLVLGMRLHDNHVTPEYAQRLDRALYLLRQERTREIMLLGGHTGSSSISEAECGRAYLIERGVPADRLHIEDVSRHTLENLQQARMRLGNRSISACFLITSRYHLARSHEQAKGFGLAHVLCAAEEEWLGTATVWIGLLREAYFLHWYRVGWWWTHLTRNSHSLSRIRRIIN